jgi:ribulose-5-phosphate 4-epimerase/fuculose-1-phosphate aldolase
MKKLIDMYESKLISHRLVESGDVYFGAIEVDLEWNHTDRITTRLNPLFDVLNISCILLAIPAEPYRTIVDFYSNLQMDTIFPRDSETRTFLHDLPVVKKLDWKEIAAVLKRRKGALVNGYGIITFGTVTPEQAFVVFSSICFSLFVKFFSDTLSRTKMPPLEKIPLKLFERVVKSIVPYPQKPPSLATAPFHSELQIYKAMEEAGKHTVLYGLVDSFFGNLSYRFDGKIYISQTTSSLDELSGCIDACPIDNSSCVGITASSELSAHKEILLNECNRAVLHGHPKFAVILSLDCDRSDCCDLYGSCHIKCPHARFINDIPIVPGEVGTGPHGLCKTIPPALRGKRGVIVYGHGVFTVGELDFNEAFKHLHAIEQMCKEEIFVRVSKTNL